MRSLHSMVAILLIAGASAQEVSVGEHAEIQRVLSGREVSDFVRWLFKNGHDPDFDDGKVVGMIIVRTINNPAVTEAMEARNEVWKLTKMSKISNMTSIPKQQYYNDAAACMKSVAELMLEEDTLVTVPALTSLAGELCPGYVVEAIGTRTRQDCKDIGGTLPAVCGDSQ